MFPYTNNSSYPIGDFGNYIGRKISYIFMPFGIIGVGYLFIPRLNSASRCITVSSILTKEHVLYYEEAAVGKPANHDIFGYCNL
jgi:hypothetical protein